MSTYCKLFAVGVLPVPVGYVINRFLTWSFFPIYATYLVFSLAVLLLWGLLAYWLSSPGARPLAQALLMNLCGLGMLALVLYQELALGQYWLNWIGTLSQSFFTLQLPIGLWLTRLIPVSRVWPAYIAEWLVMFVVSYGGCFKKASARR